MGSRIHESLTAWLGWRTGGRSLSIRALWEPSDSGEELKSSGSYASVIFWFMFGCQHPHNLMACIDDDDDDDDDDDGGDCDDDCDDDDGDAKIPVLTACTNECSSG